MKRRLRILRYKIGNFIAPFWITKYIKAKLDLWEFNRVKKIADMKARYTGKRHYVLPDWNGKLHALNRKDIEKLKKVGIMSRQVSIIVLLKEAVYITK
jgi:hypothetical protein